MVAPPAALCERWDRVLANYRPVRVVRGVQDSSIVVATRSGALVLCQLFGSAVNEAVLGQTEVVGMTTLQLRDNAFTFVLGRDGLFSGFSLAGRARFVTLQLASKAGVSVRGIGLRMFTRENDVAMFVALVQGSSGVELHTLRAEFPGQSVALELVAVEPVPAASPLVDVGEGPAGLILLHADGAVSVKVGEEWKVRVAFRNWQLRCVLTPVQGDSSCRPLHSFKSCGHD